MKRQILVSLIGLNFVGMAQAQLPSIKDSQAKSSNSITMNKILGPPAKLQIISDRYQKSAIVPQQMMNQEQVKAQTEIKLLSRPGILNGGGGASAADPQTGQRRLLDLIEKDELSYFTPDFTSSELFLSGTTKMYGEWLNHAVAIFNAMNLYVSSETYILHSEDKDKIAEAPFLYTLMRVLDTENLWKIDKNDERYDAYLDFPYRKHVCNFGKISLLKWAFTDADITELKDEGQISYENEKTKKQVAVQSNGLVIINRKEYNLLDQESKTALFLHEAVLRTVLILNPSNIAERGTQDVRTFTRRLFRFFNEKSYPAYAVLEAYEAFNIPKERECKQFLSNKPFKK